MNKKKKSLEEKPDSSNKIEIFLIIYGLPMVASGIAGIISWPISYLYPPIQVIIAPLLFTGFIMFMALIVFFVLVWMPIIFIIDGIRKKRKKNK